MENKLVLPPDLVQLIAAGTSDGIGIACSLFFQQNRMKIRPTSKSKAPIDDFVLLLTADYEKGKQGYPFSTQSVKAEIDAVVREYLPGIEVLFYDNSLPEVKAGLVKKMVRTVVAGQVLDFLEPKKRQVEELLERIRNEGVGDGPLPENGPNG